MRRREFIQSSTWAVAGALTLPAFLESCKSAATGVSTAGAKSEVGLQIYTLRDTIFKDPKGVLKQVADFGYKKLETFAYKDGSIFGMPFSDFGKYIKDLGMKVTSGHYGLDQAKSDSWEKAVTDAKSIGQEYLVVPYLMEPDRKTIDDYKKVCEALNKAAEVCQKNGMRFGYHNHAFEFQTLEGQLPYDVMLAELDKKLVTMEMDIFWVVNAGQDPLQYFQKHPGRFHQWHVKDMDKNDKMRNADVGTGSIVWKQIFAAAKQSGMKHFYVEQESYPGQPIDSVGASIKYLKTIL
jgi:sugar phosphate isomerase/epimerase